MYTNDESRPSSARRALMLGMPALLLAGCAGVQRATESAADGFTEAGPDGKGRESAHTRLARKQMRRNLPNILLYTQDGEPVRFYDDLVKDRVVLINFMYTQCTGKCPPTTRSLVKIQNLLGDRVGTDILILSISLDPEVDTPEVLKAYADDFGAGPGWVYLTGQFDEIDMLRHKLGVFDPDPILDADKANHAGLLTFGNERTGRWAALPALLDTDEIVRAVLRITREPRRRGDSISASSRSRS